MCTHTVNIYSHSYKVQIKPLVDRKEQPVVYT